MPYKGKSTICDDSMSFEECELAIVRSVIDESEKIQGSEMAKSESVQKMLSIVEKFIRQNKLICYGGTAINNILPKQDQFYNTDITIPDYDFFSTDALGDAKKLADIYAKSGFDVVEAKSGVHHGTYKVYVQYIPIADITFLSPEIFKSIQKGAIKIDGIMYTPPNYLRMSMYLELSRPKGDTSRWEKVLKRLILLNKHYPMKQQLCDPSSISRGMDKSESFGDESKIFDIIKNVSIKNNGVFFGSYAMAVYSKYMSPKVGNLFKFAPDFDIISDKANDLSNTLKIELAKNVPNNISVTVVEHDAVGEIIPIHYEILVGKNTVAFIYEPIACHSYNIVKLKSQNISVATIDTMMAFYLAFMYSNKEYHNTDKIVCMATYLFDVQKINRLSQNGPLKRFSLNCVGKQPTLDTSRAEKSEMHIKLIGEGKKGTAEWDEWFLKYDPNNKYKSKKNANDNKIKPSKTTRRTKVKKTKRRHKTRPKTKNHTTKKIKPITNTILNYLI